MSKRPAVVRLTVLLLALALVALTVAVFGAGQMGFWLDEAAESTWGPVAFVALYTLFVVLMLPGSLGTIAAGAVFGPFVGFATAMAGATLGACIAFGIARLLGRQGAVAVMAGRLESIDQFIEKRGLVAITVLRLLPVVPFNALNYAAGLSGLRFGHYLLGTLVGMAPGTFVVANVAGRASDPMSPGFVAALGSAAVAVVASIFAARRLQVVISDES